MRSHGEVFTITDLGVHDGPKYADDRLTDLSGALARRTSHQTRPPTINGGSALSRPVVHRKA